MLELQPALWLHERDDGLVTKHFHLLDTKNGNRPTLVNNHFKVLGIQYIFRRRGDGDGTLLLVEVYHPFHPFLGEKLSVLLPLVTTDNCALFATYNEW